MPSYEYPSLRQGLLGAWCPSLSVPGSLIRGWALGNHAPIGGLASGVESGYPCVSTKLGGSSSTNGNISISGNAAVSLACFAKVDSTGFTAICSVGAVNSAGFGLSVFGTAPRVDYYGSSFNSTASGNVFVTGQWFHFAGTKTPGTHAAGTTMYVNGVLVPGTGLSATPNFSGGKLFFGELGFNVGAYRGLVALDDVRVYNRALTQAEVSLLASRRGIGLKPLPDRASLKFPTTRYEKVNGVWTPTRRYEKIAGVWVPQSPSIKVGGVWK